MTFCSPYQVFKYPAIFGTGSVAALLELFCQLATLNRK